MKLDEEDVTGDQQVSADSRTERVEVQDETARR
jgi:hypothetical protein